MSCQGGKERSKKLNKGEKRNFEPENKGWSPTKGEIVRTEGSAKLKWYHKEGDSWGENENGLSELIGEGWGAGGIVG